MSSPKSLTNSSRINTNIFSKYLVIFSLVIFFFFVFLFSQTYIDSRYLLTNNIFTIKCHVNSLQGSSSPAAGTPTNLSHLKFVLAGSSAAWKHRKTYVESWWRPNVTRGNIFFEVEPSPEFRPWPGNFPALEVSEDIEKLRIYPKLGNPVAIRIIRSVIETYSLNQNEGVRWYVMGDDDTIFFLDNLVEMLSKYDHTKNQYIGTRSETVLSNLFMSFEMAYGGGGYALSYPLVETLVAKLDDCIERYHFLWAGDHVLSACLADLGVDLVLESGFHQMDLHGNLSGLLSALSSSPLLSLHHFETVNPIFPTMDRLASVVHLMKAADVDQSRLLQQSICHVRSYNWTFSVSWGYSAHIYENMFPRSHLMRPLQTFQSWFNSRPPAFMFNTRPVIGDPCEAPHWFFFDSIEYEAAEEDRVITSYTRNFPRNMTACSPSGFHSADPIAKIRVFSPTSLKEARRVECCDVEYGGAEVANIRLRDCMRDEVIS